MTIIKKSIITILLVASTNCVALKDPGSMAGMTKNGSLKLLQMDFPFEFGQFCLK